MSDTVETINTLIPMSLLDVDDTLCNQYWQFCADEVELDGRFLDDSELTYELFEMGPMYMLPAGTRVVMSHLWGYRDLAGLTEPVDYEIVLPKDATVQHAVHVILSCYHMALQGQGCTGRFYYIEQVCATANGDVEIVWGT